MAAELEPGEQLSPARENWHDLRASAKLAPGTTRGKHPPHVSPEVSSRWLPNDCALPCRYILDRPTLRRRTAGIGVADRPQDQPKPLRGSLPPPLPPAETPAPHSPPFLPHHPAFLH